MGFLSFGSKKDKMKKLIEEERFDEVRRQAIKDKKALQGLFELLNDPSPGIVGDALLLLTNIARDNPSTLGRYITPETFKKLITLMESRNSYVRENAMLFSYEIVKNFPRVTEEYREWIVEAIRRGLQEGTKDQKGFLLVVVGELGFSELRPDVEALLDVEDKVILPLEGKKWVPLGEIAKEALEKLS